MPWGIKMAQQSDADTDTSESSARRRCAFRAYPPGDILPNVHPPPVMEEEFAFNYSSSNSFAGCMHFDCDWNYTRCAPSSNTTNNKGGSERMEEYYHPAATRAPCCNDVVRQLNERFSEEMCTLGLDYAAMFGTLLGITRSGDVIPWSGDSDILVLESTMVAIREHWNATRSGISLVYFGMYRMCINSHFPHLSVWEVTPSEWLIKEIKGRRRSPIDHSRPYIDLYVGAERHRNNHSTINSLSSSENHNDNDSVSYNESKGTTIKNGTLNSTSSYFAFQPGCCLPHKYIWPTKTVQVASGAYELNVPAQPSLVLNGLYGPNWRTPDKQKSRHGVDNGNSQRTCERVRCEDLDLPMLGY